MLKCASVYTYEIDDPGVAVDEIKTHLAQKLTLLDHTIGIVMCHPEFINSGVLQHISENLPFDLVGATTSSQAVNKQTGELVLTIFVMTGDDVWFRAGVTENVTEQIADPINRAYRQATADETAQPKLALIFLPLILRHAGDSYVDVWEQIIPGTPLFGMIATDDSLSFDDSETIYRGVGYKRAMPFVLCYGNLHPRFFVGTLPFDRVMPYKGEITKSAGPFVQEINNISSYKYFEEIGFASNGAFVENYIMVPFVIDQKERDDYDGIPVVRSHASFTENGTAIFRGAVDQGSTFTLLNCDPEGILATTREKVEEVNQLPDINGVLMISCIARRMMTQRIGPMIDLDIAKDALKPEVPFMIGYAGGEVCPTSVRDRIPTNRFHNYSLIILVV